MRLLIFFFSCFFSLLLFGQEKAILKVMNEQKIAWNNGDIEGYMEGYWNSDSLIFIGSNGFTYGWKTIFENYKKGYSTREKMGKLNFTDVKVKKLGRKHAFVIGRWQIQQKEKEIGGIFTLIFKKFRKGWKIISDHTE